MGSWTGESYAHKLRSSLTLNRGRTGKTRVRVHDASLSVFLHDGYDWVRTRKVIEDEIKLVRRRLERIRQILASGQKADESMGRENQKTSSLLYNSVYIGLPERPDLTSDELIAAIDDELDDLNAETASQSSWQSFPDAPDRPRRTGSHRTRLRGKRLTRSKRAQVEISLSNIRADIDLFEPGEDITTRCECRVQTFEILDHIKTSTWKKFLGEMKIDGRRGVRESDADMIRLEVLAIRPTGAVDDELRVRVRANLLLRSPVRVPLQLPALRLRSIKEIISDNQAKMLPLRLHIDQDALDFMKRFFAFTVPPTETTIASLPPLARKARKPYFRESLMPPVSELSDPAEHVEIYPVQIKLDYKPKRVDFAALKEGRTIELMNFFHFEGAEMTLRHVTLSGVRIFCIAFRARADIQISGTTRLSNMLQDIWTPDVKANQLADVVSGVSPIRSLVNVGSGMADLILLPIEQYRKDGRLGRGVQRGTNSFVRGTAMEVMKLGARLATGTQVILEKAEGVLGGRFGENVTAEVPEGPIDSDLEEEEGTVEVLSRYANQPGNVAEGVKQGYRSLSRNVNSAAQTILAVPMEVYERPNETASRTRAAV